MKSERRSALFRLAPALLAGGFFLLYLATCQRGWCWQDSGLFQRRIFSGDLAGRFGIASSHPLFVELGMAADWTCRLFSDSIGARLFVTNAMSALWMALAVGFFSAAVRRYAGSAMAALVAGFALGFAHMAWWLGTICESYALELMFFSMELCLLLGWTRENAFSRGIALALVGGLHFSVHNMALLALPVYAFVAWRLLGGNRRVAKAACLAGVWVFGATPVLLLAAGEASRSGIVAAARSVLVGEFGSQVIGVTPPSAKIFALNAALAAMSFAMPAICALLGRRQSVRSEAARSFRTPLLFMLAVHALFLVRYFVPDQAFFILPTLALSILLVSPRLAEARSPALVMAVLAAAGVLLPVVAVQAAPKGLDRGTHPGRDDVRYFALPWKSGDTSCDKVVKENGLEDSWDGYLGKTNSQRRSQCNLFFPEMRMSDRPRAYNWWMDGAVSREGLEAQADAMREGGFGGIHVIHIYGAKNPESPVRPYLSEPWMQGLGDALEVYGRYGMSVDMTTGSGWCFGGPLGPENGAMKLTATNGTVEASYTRQRVKRAGIGGEGPMLDPYSTSAMSNFLARFSAAFPKPKEGDERPARSVQYMYHDSWEYYGAGWTPGFREAFRRRRGYDIEDHKAEMAGVGDPEKIARVKHDYRETLDDLVNEESFPIWVEWCHERGFKTRNEAHGSTANWLDFYALSDMPETEMFRDDRDVIVSKFASSAANFKWINDGAAEPSRNSAPVSSETGTWLGDHFCGTLGDMKMFVDGLFLSGVNQIYYHGMCYSPPDAPWPGWCFYASFDMNPRNPIFRDVAMLNDYAARCQAMFRECESDNDILLYYPVHDWWWDDKGFEKQTTVHDRKWLYDYPVGDVAKWLQSQRYCFDWVSDRMLARLKPGKGPWKTIVVPPNRHMPEATKRRLEELSSHFEVVWCRDGEMPDIRRARKIGLCGASGNDAAPGVEHVGAMRFRRDGYEVYFFVNRRAGKDACVSFGVPVGDGLAAIGLDPLRGRVLGTIGAAEGKDGSPVEVRLAPGESVFVEVGRFPVPDRSLIQAAELVRISSVMSVSGRKALSLDGEWKMVPVCGGPEPLPAERTVKVGPSLWNVVEPGGEEVPFCGTMRYSTKFSIPGDSDLLFGKGDDPVLDLGEVHESARVKVNGKDLGCVIMAPYRFVVPHWLLKPSGNELEVEVTSTAANRIRWMDRNGVEWKRFKDTNMVDINYHKFDASKWPNRPCGLAGPVTMSLR